MASSSGTDAPELPGFYYDSQKGRYFRLLPGTNNHNPLTQKMVFNERDSTDDKHLSRKRKSNVTNLLQQRSTGLLCGQRFEENSIHSKLHASDWVSDVFLERCYPVRTVCQMQPDKSYENIIEILHNPSESYYASMRNHKGVHPIARCGRDAVFCACQSSRTVLCADVYASKLCLFDVRRSGKHSITCKSPFTCAIADSRVHRYIASCGAGSNVILISNFDALFSGREIHPRGGRGHTVIRLHRDILSQRFSTTIHFNGLRGGTVVGLDLRNRTSCCRLDAPEVCNPRHLYTMKDDKTLIIGYENPGVDPKMYLWDIRFTRKPVFKFLTELGRRRTSSITPMFTLNVDQEERVVTSVLPDCKARIWSLLTGDVMMVFPDDEQDQRFVTSAAYTNNWNMYKRKTGMLVYIKEISYEGYEFLDIAPG